MTALKIIGGILIGVVVTLGVVYWVLSRWFADLFKGLK